MAYFYSHLIEIETVTAKLDELDLTDEQRARLATLVDATLHHTILDLILSKLSSVDKKAFTARLQEDYKDRKLLEFLKSKIDNIEEEIQKAAEKVKRELHEDMEEAKKQ